MTFARPTVTATRAVTIAITLALVTAACGTSNSTAPTTSACAGEIRAAGVFPDLESLLPLGMIERSPDTLDSGRGCSAESLGSYATHGVGEINYAGATWDGGGGNATVVAIFTTPAGEPPLQAQWVEEFYELGAWSGRRIENVETGRPSIGDAGPVWRLDALNDLSLQTIVVWPAGRFVRVVIVATTVNPDASREDHDQRVRIAVDVAHAVPVPIEASRRATSSRTDQTLVLLSPA